MGVLEDAIKALEEYEKHQTVGDYHKVLHTTAMVGPKLEKFTKLSMKFNTRINAEKLGWVILEDLSNKK